MVFTQMSHKVSFDVVALLTDRTLQRHISLEMQNFDVGFQVSFRAEIQRTYSTLKNINERGFMSIRNILLISVIAAVRLP